MVPFDLIALISGLLKKIHNYNSNLIDTTNVQPYKLLPCASAQVLIKPVRHLLLNEFDMMVPYSLENIDNMVLI